MTHRVRSLITHLDYSTLTKDKKLPSQKLFTRATVPSKGGRVLCPTLSQKLGPSEYGLFVESVVETILTQNFQNIDMLKYRLDDDIQPYYKPESFKNFSEVLEDSFDGIDKSTIYPQYELLDLENDISGHPDIVCEDVVYDIKTTGRFGAMRILTIFQLLSYFCLAQRMGKNIRYIGLILPLQNDIITYDLSEWNWEPFYSELIQAKTLKLNRLELYQYTPEEMLKFMMIKPSIGYHCPKYKLIEDVENSSPPRQFFVNGTVGGTVKIDPVFEQHLKDAISSSSTPVFIHSPYSINLSNPGKGKRQGDEKLKDEFGWGGWTFKCIKDLLDFGNRVGIRGVVVHCGRAVKIDQEVAIENMKKSVNCVGRWASIECPLLIETSSGQGSEVLYSPQDLSDFYNSLDNSVQSKVGVCVDTCHTFAAGYDPFKFISILQQNFVGINLIHFNDSKCSKGSKKDRHAPFMHGHVGFKPLFQVASWAFENKIPMVVE